MLQLLHEAVVKILQQHFVDWKKEGFHEVKDEMLAKK